MTSTEAERAHLFEQGYPLGSILRQREQTEEELLLAFGGRIGMHGQLGALKSGQGVGDS
ncbi:MAG: hypothetical protein QF689_00515 [Candidatus Latescibacteria bacterium]|nr:hypothetical protein [Candidatus Latescibacterota bacterium]MDP7447042.1 hypothetical protein [Candidatus Latescibacterota bacterium]MDP7631800.1 hypothetical protein [Candidatus Latescibacterota bacterium]MEE3336641.1 hypothetical protein [Candidatus Latescibacterota bacterium]HJN27015.1 hypothetical protein [Candidatus Latescibacterota bacterium]